MVQSIIHIALVVKDYDEAIDINVKRCTISLYQEQKLTEEIEL